MWGQASEAKYLGVPLSCDMEWAKHIQQVTSSCSSTIGLLHRNLSDCPIQLRERAYISLIRSRLEYASAIWDPPPKKHITTLEAIQRKAAHFITQDFRRTSSVSRMLDDLRWLILKERQRDIKQFKLSRTRWRFLWRIFSRGQTPGPEAVTTEYRQLPTNSTQYLHSFFPSTIPEWNRLSQACIDADTLPVFKAVLRAAP